MIPTSVGGKPRKNPAGPSCAIIFLANAIGLLLPNFAFDDWSWVLMTSSGFVIVEATVPATPPEKRLTSEYHKMSASSAFWSGKFQP